VSGPIQGGVPKVNAIRRKTSAFLESEKREAKNDSLNEVARKSMPNQPSKGSMESGGSPPAGGTRGRRRLKRVEPLQVFHIKSFVEDNTCYADSALSLLAVNGELTEACRLPISENEEGQWVLNSEITSDTSPKDQLVNILSSAVCDLRNKQDPRRTTGIQHTKLLEKMRKCDATFVCKPGEEHDFCEFIAPLLKACPENPLFEITDGDTARDFLMKGRVSSEKLSRSSKDGGLLGKSICILVPPVMEHLKGSLVWLSDKTERAKAQDDLSTLSDEGKIATLKQLEYFCEEGRVIKVSGPLKEEPFSVQSFILYTGHHFVSVCNRNGQWEVHNSLKEEVESVEKAYPGEGRKDSVFPVALVLKKIIT